MSFFDNQAGLVAMFGSEEVSTRSGSVSSDFGEIFKIIAKFKK